MNPIQHSICPLCGRQTHLSFHHFIPRKVHRRTYFRKQFTRQQLGQGVMICRACHSGIHAAYNEMQLAKYYNTLSLLQADEKLQAHFKWVSKQRVQL